jgi:hypothetical protein
MPAADLHKQKQLKVLRLVSKETDQSGSAMKKQRPLLGTLRGSVCRKYVVCVALGPRQVGHMCKKQMV